MEILESEFEQAVRNVTISGDKRTRAIAAHTEVRELLEGDAELKSWDIDSVLIGSYARQTARYPGKDVDVFLRFKSLSARHDPGKIYAAVDRVLVDQYGIKGESVGGRVTRQARSLKIDFADPDVPGGDGEFSIDAVPAVPWGDHWGIPNRERDLWDKEDKRWIKTNPVQFAEDTNTLSTASWSPTVKGSNAYWPIVRLLRQVRHVHLGDQRPGGLFVEVAAYYVWSERLVSGSTWAELLVSTLDEVGKRMEIFAESGIPDPILKTPMKPELEAWHWKSASMCFEGLADRGREALESERCRAAKIWREVLGSNDRGQVLPLPQGCDAAGFPIGAVTAVSALGSNQARGFAFAPLSLI